jgi:non-specific serine/threonine protein kinase
MTRRVLSMPRYEREVIDRRASRPDDSVRVRPLTQRERQVALLVADGLKNASIARQLTLSPATVATYIRRIQSRLGLSTRRQIAAWVAERDTARHRDILPE